MCGIAGVYEYGRAVGNVTSTALVAMQETLQHRGPDGAGLYVSDDHRVGFAHRRLAIVDVRGGAQPMFGEDGECLVFNGEIYNYPALRRSLERQGVAFRTRCDTEVILHLYRRYGDALVDHLNGMFAFALWDPNRRRLLMARDHVGEKPLYWTDSGGRLLFASEVKALLAHPAVTAELNGRALPGYLANLTSIGPETLYRGINKLPPGSVAVCDERGIDVSRYWDITATRRFTPVSEPEATRTVRRLLEASVTDRLMSDVPVGVLLSGGLDSTTLVGLLRGHVERLPTFSVGFAAGSQCDERAEAKWVADHYGTDHHEVVVSESEATAFLARLVHHQDEPLADPVCIPLHFVCELARREGVPVVLAGEGSDELFWGYPQYRTVMTKWRWIEAVLALPGPARRALARLGSRQTRRRDFLASVAAGRPSPPHAPLGLPSPARRSVLRGADTGTWIPRPAEPGRPPLETFAFDTQEYEFALRLPELLLMRIDRFSMASSVEARVPFLERALVEYVYGLPLSLKLTGGKTKLVLRRAVADAVPDRVLSRPKQGFGAPVGRWLQGLFGDLFEVLLTDEVLSDHLRVDYILDVLHEHREGRRDATRILWPILNFALWHKRWVAGDELEGVLDRIRAHAP